MLKRTRDTVRAVAESTGLLAPSIADAQATAEQRRQALTGAQAAVNAATAAQDAAHDAGAPAGDILKAEAAVADAKMTADRAQLAYAAAERRLSAAKDAEAEKLKAAAIVKRDAARAAYTKAVGELDRLAGDMAKQAQIVDAQHEAFHEARAAGVAGLFTPVSGGTLAALAVERAMAEQAGQFTGSKPSAADAAERVLGAVLAVA